MLRELDYRAMGERVRRRRRELELTQEQLAELVGLSLSFIGHIERGEKKASADTIVALCEKLDVSADYLLRGVRSRCDPQGCALYREMTGWLAQFGER